MRTRKARKPQFDPRDVQRAAMLAAMGLTQAEVAKEMLISLPKLCRLIREARDRGILGPPIIPIDWSLVDDEVWDLLCDPGLAADTLRRLTRYGVAHVRLVRTDADPLRTEFRVMRLAALVLAGVMPGRARAGRRAAAAAAPAMSGPVLGLTGGSLLRLAIDHADLPARAPDMTLVALAGDPACLPSDPDYAWSMQSSANGIVGKLANRMRLAHEQVWRFPLPAAWSAPSPEASAAFLQQLARDVPGVRIILGGRVNEARDPDQPEPLLDRMGTVFAELAAPAPATPQAPSDPEWVAGRVNGHLLARREANAAAVAECERRNRFALGASPAELARVAARARPHYLAGRGVILMASGPAAAEGVLALVTAGAVNELIIDSETARSILRGLKRPAHGEAPLSLRAAV